MLGGPSFRVRYPNGDQTSYVTTVFDASVTSGAPRPDGDEILDVGWFTPSDLGDLDLHPVGASVLQGCGVLPTSTESPDQSVRPRRELAMVVLVTGLQATGKSTLAAMAADHLGAPFWPGIGSWPAYGCHHRTRPVVDDAWSDVVRREVGWTLVWQLATAELRRRRPVVLDGVARAEQIRRTRELAAEEAADCVIVHTRCDDETIQRARIETRTRGIPGWYKLDWEHVAQSRQHWEQPPGVDLDLDSTGPIDRTRRLLLDRLGPPRR